MSRDNKELRELLKNLSTLVDEINQVLSSTKSVSSKRLETTIILMKINKYKKLRQELQKSYNNELEVTSLMEIFADTEHLIKEISEGDSVSEYMDKGFFKKFSDIADEAKRLAGMIM